MKENHPQNSSLSDITPEYTWLDVANQTVKLDADDSILVANWTKNKVVLRTSIKESLKSTITIMFYFSISAIIVAIFSARSRSLDNAMDMLFFPVVGYILVAYRGIDKFIKAALLGIFSLYFVLYPLLLNHLIDYYGVVYLYYMSFVSIIPLFKNIPEQMEASSVTNLLSAAVGILLIFLLIEFLLMILYAILKKPEKVEYILSAKALFLRFNSKRSIWEDIKLIFYAIINPLSVQQYIDIRDRVKYKRLKTREGMKFDHVKIPWEETRQWKYKPDYSNGKTCLAVILLILGLILSRADPVFYILLLFGLIILFTTIAHRKTATISFKFNRPKAEGSWMLTNNANDLVLKQMPLSQTSVFFLHIQSLNLTRQKSQKWL